MSKKMGASFLEYRSPRVASLERRLFLRQGLSLGALALLAYAVALASVLPGEARRTWAALRGQA